MIEYLVFGVKKSVIVVVGQMCICVYKVNQELQFVEIQTALINMLFVVVLEFLVVMGEDIDSLVVMFVIDILYEMLDKIGYFVIQV